MTIKYIEKTIRTYRLKKGYRVDAITENGTTELWLYREDYGVKEFMFGIAEGSDVAEQLMLYNIDDYIGYYEERYITDDHLSVWPK